MTSKQPIASDATPLMYVVFKDGPWPGLAYNPHQLYFGQITALIAHKHFVGYYAVPQPSNMLISLASSTWARELASTLPVNNYSLSLILRKLGRKHLPVLPAWWVHEGFEWPSELLADRRQQVLAILDRWYEEVKQS